MSEKKKVLLTGSLAYDVIFTVPVDFRQSIPLESGEIRSFNATYIANDKVVHLGGTAGNIGVWLAESKSQAEISLYSAWGKDLSEKNYHQKLIDLGIELRGEEGEFTASAYTVSDPLHQQLIIWQPNAYEKFYHSDLTDFYSDQELSEFDWAVFSAGNPDSILRHMTQLRSVNPTVKIILDPGQITPFFEAENFQKVVGMSDVLIGNDIEFQHFSKYLNQKYPSDLVVIETLGSRGVLLRNKNQETTFPARKAAKVVETTGAGDAFRAGLLSVLCEQEDWKAAIEKGCEFGARCVELPSAQS